MYNERFLKVVNKLDLVKKPTQMTSFKAKCESGDWLQKSGYTNNNNMFPKLDLDTQVMWEF